MFTPSLFHLPSEVAARAKQFSQELGQAMFPGFEVLVTKTLLGLPNEHEWTYVRKDGSLFWVDTVSKPQKAGDPLVRMVLVTELTEIVKVETQVADQARFLETLLNALPLPVFYADRQGRYLGANPAYEALTGLSHTDLLGKTPAECLPARISRGVESKNEALFSAREQIQHYTKQIPTPDRGLRDIDFWKATFRNHEGQVAGLIGMGFDMTEQRETMTALRDSESRMVQVLHGTPVPTFVIDAQHRVVHWNPACERILGLSAQEMMGETDVWRVFYPGPRPVMANLIVDGGDTGALHDFYGETCARSYVNPDAFESVGFFAHMDQGAGRWLHFCASPLRDGQGRVVGAIETLMDITEQKKAEDRVRLLNEDLELRVHARTNELAQANEELRTAIDQLVQAEKLASLGRLVAGVAHVLTKTPVKLVQQLEPGIAMHSYPGPLVQVVTNLIMNALLHGFEANQTGTIVVSCRRNEDLVLVTVRDDGQGIPPAILDKIFDPFFTTKLGQGGTGLGLYISHNIVHGPLRGSLSVQSNPGKGTTFTLKLPCALGARCNGHSSPTKTSDPGDQHNPLCGLIHSHL